MPPAYRLDTSADQIASAMRADPARDVWQGGEVVPGGYAPVIVHDKEKGRHIVPRQCGVPPPPRGGRVPFAQIARRDDPVELLERHAFSPMALSTAGGCLLKEWHPEPRTAVILGAEGPGLSANLIRRVQSVQIAMSAGFDSFNVATTSGIVLHHISACAPI